MDSKHEDLIVETATDVRWLVEANKYNIKKNEAQDGRIGSLEKSRARTKGAWVVAGVLASFSGLAYRIWGN